MSLFTDLKPFLQVARVFGFAPYSLNSVDLPLSRIGVIYSFFCAIVYASLLYIRFQILASPDVEIKLRFLTILRTVLSECVIFVDIFVCIKFHDKLCASLEFMQRYDQAVKLEATPKLITTRCWFVLGAIAIYFLSLGAFTYYYETWRPLESSIIYVILYSSTTYGIIKFSAIVASLLRRFRHLNRLIKTGWFRRQLNLRDVWSLHGCLVAAAEKLNSLYSAQLLLWITGLTLNAISRIYVFCELDGFVNFKKVIREGGIAAVFVSLLTVLAAVCHMTAAEFSRYVRLSWKIVITSLESYEREKRILLRFFYSGKQGRIYRIFSGFEHFPTTPPKFRHGGRYREFYLIDVVVLFDIDRKVRDLYYYSQDNMQIGMYFLLHRFNFSAAAGFVQVDLPLLQTIAGTMTTYLVILKAPG